MRSIFSSFIWSAHYYCSIILCCDQQALTVTTVMQCCVMLRPSRFGIIYSKMFEEASSQSKSFFQTNQNLQIPSWLSRSKLIRTTYINTRTLASKFSDATDLEMKQQAAMHVYPLTSQTRVPEGASMFSQFETLRDYICSMVSTLSKHMHQLLDGHLSGYS